MFDFSPIQIAIVLLIVLVVFGPKRLPELGRSIGKGLREFRSSMSSDDDERTPTVPTRDPARTAVAEDPEILEGVVVSGSEPPRPPTT
ncbi:MAG: sec-independent protein translocase protein TatA [Miltoncostaeaceae bacterium]|jgi:sec-independent protein translocase protein TatA|nr:sec-independent protein translocase protein TatA [Miltoncostaeaceae bacterium]